MSAFASTVAALGTGFDQDFESGIRILREAHLKKVAMKDTEISQLRSELAHRESENKELQARVQQLESQLTHSDRRAAEMSRVVSKLASFKQSVMESLANDEDVEELRAGIASAGSARATGAGVSSPLFAPSSTIRAAAPRHAGNVSPESDRQTDEFIASLQPTRPRPPRRQPSIADAIGFTSAAQRQQQLQVPQRSAPTPSPSPTTPGPIDTSSAAAVAHGFSSYLRDPGGGQPVPAAVAAAPPPKSVSFERRGGEASAGSASDSAGGSVDGREFFKRARATLSYDESLRSLTASKTFSAIGEVHANLMGYRKM
ncbi:hypothetical protein HK405_008917, partial [Cladochytrium tenue]